MRLQGKRLLTLVSDGVDQIEFLQIRSAFEEEGATVLVTTPGEYLVVETVNESRRGGDIMVDLPFDSVDVEQFDGLIVPDGLIAIEELRKSRMVLEMVGAFHGQDLPIFASGEAVEVLKEAGILFDRIVVRDGISVDTFLDKAMGVLLDAPDRNQAYRLTATS